MELVPDKTRARDFDTQSNEFEWEWKQSITWLANSGYLLIAAQPLS